MTTYASGPRTKTGKAIAARNATTHGVFCRQTVLPHLGEDPAAYQQLLDTLINELRPRNLMKRQYLELWAEASWKLRRLARWEAQLWENDALDEDTRFQKLERVSRLQNTLRRNLDRALRALNRDVQWLYERRTREDVLAKTNLTEAQCRENTYRAQEVERAVQANRTWPGLPDDFDSARLDNAPTPSGPVGENEQNELAENQQKNCQNELPSPAPVAELPCETTESIPSAPVIEEETPPAPPEEPSEAPVQELTPREQRRARLQYLEDLLNSGTLTQDERHQLLVGGEINHVTLGGGRYTIHK